MKHECGLCLRDNLKQGCQIKKSYWQIMLGKVNDCMIYHDYRTGLEQKKDKEINDKNLSNFRKVFG